MIPLGGQVSKVHELLHGHLSPDSLFVAVVQDTRRASSAKRGGVKYFIPPDQLTAYRLQDMFHHSRTSYYLGPSVKMYCVFNNTIELFVEGLGNIARMEFDLDAVIFITALLTALVSSV